MWVTQKYNSGQMLRRAVFSNPENTVTVDDLDNVNELLRLAYGEQHAKEICEMDLSFSALTELVNITLSAMTGKEPEENSGSSAV